MSSQLLSRQSWRPCWWNYSWRSSRTASPQMCPSGRDETEYSSHLCLPSPTLPSPPCWAQRSCSTPQTCQRRSETPPTCPSCLTTSKELGLTFLLLHHFSGGVGRALPRSWKSAHICTIQSCSPRQRTGSPWSAHSLWFHEDWWACWATYIQGSLCFYSCRGHTFEERRQYPYPLLTALSAPTE